MQKTTTPLASQPTESLLQQRQALNAQMDKPQVGFFRAWWIGIKSLFAGTAAYVATDTLLHQVFPSKDAQPVENVFKALIHGRLEPQRVAAGLILSGTFAVTARKIWSNRIALNRAEIGNELAQVNAQLVARGVLVPEHVITPHESEMLRVAQADGQAVGQHSTKAVNAKEHAQSNEIAV
jgi:hypothetical protein